jgi:phosphate-selective porin OprO/OprP
LVATRWVAGLVAAVLSAAAAFPSQAAGPAAQADVSDHERRIRELEETVDRLKKDTRQVEVSLENQKPLAGWSDGFNLASTDGRFKLKVGAYTQADGRFFIDDDGKRSANQFTFRRVRPNFEGTVFKYFDFRLLPDFAGSKAVLFDAHLDLNYLPEAKLRFGKFKPPVGLERLQSATNLLFVERGLPTDLVPNRDNGVQLFGELLGGTLTYAGGVFNGVPDGGNGDIDVNDDKDFAGRVFALPFKSIDIGPLKGLGIGIAGTYGRQRGSQSSPDLPSLKTTGQTTFFSYKSNSTDATKTVVAFGQHTRISPQGYYYFGPFGLLGEYVRSEQAVGLNNKFATLTNDSWQIAASCVITGEAASYKGLAPAQPFDPWQGKWGAFEVAARYGELDIDDDAFSQGFADPKKAARKAKEWVVGANWYLNKNVKFVLNYANTDFRGGTASGDRKTEKVFLSRVQLAF